MWLLPQIKKDFLCPKLNSLEIQVILCAFQIGGSLSSFVGWVGTSPLICDPVEFNPKPCLCSLSP